MAVATLKMPTTRDKDVVKFWIEEKDRAEKKRKPRLDDAKKFDGFISGMNKLQIPGAEEDDAKFQGWFRAHYPLLRMLVDTLFPMLMPDHPEFFSKTPAGSSEVVAARSEIFTQLLNYIMRENRGEAEGARRQYGLALWDCFHTGIGVIEHDLDKRRRIGRVTFRHSQDVLIDPGAGPNEDTVRWVAIREKMTVNNAVRKWKGHKAVILEAAGTASAATEDLMFEYEATDDVMHPHSVTVWRVYRQGGNPHSKKDEKKEARAAEKSGQPAGAGDRPKVEENLWYGARHSVVEFLESDKDKFILLSERNLPFVIDRDSLPVTFIRLTLDLKEFWPKSILDHLYASQWLANWGLTFDATDTFNSVQQLIWADEDIDDQTMNWLLRPQSGARSVMKSRKRGKRKPFEILKFDAGSKEAARLGANAAAVFMQASGLPELQGQPTGGTSHVTATAEANRAAKSELKIAPMVSRMKAAMIDSGRKLVQINQSMMDVDDVAAIVGEEKLQIRDEYMLDPSDPAQKEVLRDKDGNPIVVRISDIWRDDWTREEIEKEVNTVLDVSSMRFTSREQRARELIQLKQQIQMDIASLVQMGVQVNGVRIARMLFEITNKIAMALGIENFDQLMPDISELIQVPMEVPGGGGAAPSAQPSTQTGGANPPNPAPAGLSALV
ncbi:MAG: hypothetical protein QGM45_11465 [Anaerolineales bacterium]|nr:hypothetical protein [Anaerolineales bacterium]